MNDLRCPACGREGRTGPTYPYRCLCGGLWSMTDPGVYPVEATWTTPIWPDPIDPDLLWKREDLGVTGSFKDRGAAVLVPLAARCGADALLVDSSGSAALAAASAAARAGLPITVHTPARLPGHKRDALEMLGARVVAEGTREAAAVRAIERADREFYVSHVYHPAFHLGTARAGTEVLEQLKGRVPSRWVVPVGNGSLLLGLARALAGVRNPAVRLVAVQAESCPGLERPGAAGTSCASGIAIGNPARRGEILEAITRHHGEVILAGEQEIRAARETLGRRGVVVEAASAAALVAVERLRARGETGPILGWLTGSGFRG